MCFVAVKVDSYIFGGVSCLLKGRAEVKLLNALEVFNVLFGGHSQRGSSPEIRKGPHPVKVQP
jgi:hypothetical protein